MATLKFIMGHSCRLASGHLSSAPTVLHVAIESLESDTRIPVRRIIERSVILSMRHRRTVPTWPTRASGDSVSLWSIRHRDGVF
jgi:hypothetical protein